MKRIFYSCIFILCSMASVYAYSFKVDGIYYNILSGTTEVEVTNETGEINANSYTGSVVIPSTVSYNSKSYTVTTIGESSFRGCKNLTSVIIPESIRVIKSYAFRGCTGLTEVTLPESVSELKSHAFSNCDALQEVHVQSSEPPTISPSAFMNISSNKIKVYIPKGSEAEYLASEVWKDMDLVMNEYDIIVEVYNPEYGTVSGNGRYKYNSEAMIEALPSAGYSFDKWDDGNTENPRTIKVVGDATYTANFVGADYTVTVTSADENMGTVTASPEKEAYYYNDKVTVTAAANAGYEFLQWSDDNTEATREIIITSDTTLTATFAAIVEPDPVVTIDNAEVTVDGEFEAEDNVEAKFTVKAADLITNITFEAEGVTFTPATIAKDNAALATGVEVTAAFKAVATKGENTVTITVKSEGADSRTVTVKYTVTEKTGVANVTVASTVWSESGMLFIEAAAETQATVYTLQGQVVETLNLTQGVNAVALPSAVYVVKVGETAVKVSVK